MDISSAFLGMQMMQMQSQILQHLTTGWLVIDLLIVLVLSSMLRSPADTAKTVSNYFTKFAWFKERGAQYKETIPLLTRSYVNYDSMNSVFFDAICYVIADYIETSAVAIMRSEGVHYRAHELYKQRYQWLYWPNSDVHIGDVTVSFTEESENVPARDGIKSKSVVKRFVHISAPSKDVCDAFKTKVVADYAKFQHDVDSEDVNNSISVFDACHDQDKMLLFKEYTKVVFFKTFKSVFFENKTNVLKQIDDFLERRQTFAPEKERPYKLGILLHGEPGTGKTSFIRALASYTKRHVLIASLSSIDTVDKLHSLFRDTTVMMEDESCTVPFHKRLIVFEDFDASDENNVLGDRKGKPQAEEVKLPKSDVIMRTTPKITLSHMLNALDGIFVPHGLIFVITTNHIDRFDPALLRPGRIDINLYMTYVTPAVASDIVSYYFERPVTVERVKPNLTGAQVENACLRYPESLEEVLKCIQ